MGTRTTRHHSVGQQARTGKGRPENRKPRWSASWLLLRETAQAWYSDDVPTLAAAIAFYTVFSLAPSLMIAVGVAGVFTGEQAARSELITVIAQVIGPSAAEFLRTILQDATFNQAGPLLTLTGVVLAFIGATAVFVELQSALNKIWDATAKPRHFWRSILYARILSFLIVVGIGLLPLLSLAASAAFSIADRTFSSPLPLPPAVFEGLNFLLSFLLLTMLVATVYRVIPDVDIDWSDVWIGALVTSLLMIAARFVIGVYLANSGLRYLYGTASSLVVILLWVYFSVQIFLLGAEFTQVYATHHGSRTRPRRDGGQPV
jgi:membrane protein